MDPDDVEAAWTELGLPPNAPLDEARRAWRSAARSAHPDRGGDPAAFNRKRAAWATLRNRTGCANVAPAAVDPGPWTRARAINRAVELDLQVEDMGDDTGVTADGTEVLWFTDDGVEIDGELYLWAELDDELMLSVSDLVGA